MALAVERYEGNSIWLVVIPSPKEPSTRLAQFINEDAVKAFWADFNIARLVAHEHGRSGI